MLNLTHKEKSALKAILLNAESACGAKNAGQLLDDNYSWFTAKDLEENSRFNQHQVAGLISSLLEKNIIDIDYDDPELFYVPENILMKLPKNINFINL